MKRMTALILLLVFLGAFSGCAEPEEKICSFYYLRSPETVRYGQSDALIAPVTRHFSDQNAETEYLLQLYLDGPTEEGFHSPIPRGVYLLSSLWEEDTLILVLSREFSTLDNIYLTLAGACLAATCHDLTGAERIQVRSGEQIYTFDLNQFTFLEVSTGQ